MRQLLWSLDIDDMSLLWLLHVLGTVSNLFLLLFALLEFNEAFGSTGSRLIASIDIQAVYVTCSHAAVGCPGQGEILTND